MQFHAHVFFELSQQSEAEQMRSVVVAALPHRVKVGPLLLRAAGPLPKPMFLLEFESAQLPEVRQVLARYRGTHSVLIHPLLDDEYAAHTEHAQWLGTVLPLNLDRL